MRIVWDGSSDRPEVSLAESDDGEYVRAISGCCRSDLMMDIDGWWKCLGCMKKVGMEGMVYGTIYVVSTVKGERSVENLQRWMSYWIGKDVTIRWQEGVRKRSR